jgi:NAD(P)H dehydrogenase (quinone)
VPHIRSTYFAEWVLYISPTIRQGVLVWPLSLTGRHAPIAPQDQAKVIAGVRENPEPHRNEVYLVFGPVEMTPTEIAKILSQVSGKEIQYRQIDPTTSFKKMASQWKVAHVRGRVC